MKLRSTPSESHNMRAGHRKVKGQAASPLTGTCLPAGWDVSTQLCVSQLDVVAFISMLQ